MSDPVSNAEVEDVLSSIRRLVSEEKRTPSADAPEASDRLVLTPALRVADDTPVSDETEEHIDHHEHGDAATDNFETGEGEAATSENHEDHAEHMVAQHETDDAGDDHSSDDTYEEHSDETHEPEQVEAEAAQDNTDTQHEQNDDTVVDLEAVEWPAQNMASIHDAFEDLQTDEPAAEPRNEENAEAASLSAKIEALETVIGKTDDQWEPDDTGDSDYSGTEAPAMAWEETEVAEEPVAQNDADIFGAGDDFLDEDALRDLVSDIVREELQGALGERITRNVRKLVRREIHRALAAQELE